MVNHDQTAHGHADFPPKRGTCYSGDQGRRQSSREADNTVGASVSGPANDGWADTGAEAADQNCDVKTDHEESPEASDLGASSRCVVL